MTAMPTQRNMPMRHAFNALAVATLASALAVQADGAEIELETVVVTATRVERSLADVARSLSVIDRLEIESIQARSVAGVLAYQPNVSISGGPRPSLQTVNIRGLTGNKVLQTIDGARMSFESGHRPSYFLDPELLQRVEALRGPAGSLWGSGALGGVVAQSTIEPGNLLGARAVGGFLRTGLNSNNGQSTTTLAIAGTRGATDGLVSGYYRSSDDLELGNGDTLSGSASRDRGLLAKLNWRPADGHRLQANIRGAINSGAVPSNGTAELNGSSNFLLERDTETRNASLRWDFDPAAAWLNGRALLYWNQVEVDESRIADRRADNTRLDEYGLNLINQDEMFGVKLQYGADIYRERFEASRSGLSRPLPPEAVTDVWSVYGQATVPLSADWRVDLGLRYDDFSTEAENLDNRRGDSDASASAALVWTPWNLATLALRYDEAFRAPTAEELYTSGTHFCLGPGFCNQFLPNAGLEAEQAANIELLGQFGFSDVLGADALTFQVSVFRNSVDNFIEQVVGAPSFGPIPDPGVTRWVNVDEATIEGVELEGSYRRGRWLLTAAYGMTRGEDDRSGQDLTNIPADTFVADVSYHFPANGLIAGVRYTDASDQRRTDVPENDGGVTFAGYSLTDLYLSWEPGALPALKFDLNVNNLTDEFYQRAWSQLPAVGREVILSARYSF